jgi:hypothetical protein
LRLLGLLLTILVVLSLLLLTILGALFSLLLVVLFIVLFTVLLVALIIVILLTILLLLSFSLLRFLQNRLDRILSRIGDALLLKVPLLHGDDDVNSKLAVLSEGLVPLRRHARFAGNQVSGNTADEQLAHGRFEVGVGVDVLDAAEGGVCVRFLVPVADALENLQGKIADFPLLGLWLLLA